MISKKNRSLFISPLYLISILFTTNLFAAAEVVPDASMVDTNTSAFNNNLSSADNTVQKALDTLDNMTASGGSVSDAVYGVGWNGDTTTAPSKNAVYDKIELVSAGGATAWDAIGDATADGSIALAGFETDWTSTLDSNGKAIFTITNTDADTAADTDFIDLIHNDGADANIFYLRCIGDADGTPQTDYRFSQTAALIRPDLTVTGDITITGDDLFMTTNTSGAALIADGTNFNPVVISGDVAIGTTGIAAIQANSVALTTDTTGNYAGGDAEAGNALTGDTATAFFAAGTIEHERGGLEADINAYDGLIGITGGATYNVTGTTTQIVIFDGAGAPTVAALSSDATMTNAGAVTIANNAVALATDTTGAYVADLTAGTAIDVSGGGAENATVTVDWDSTEVEGTTWGAGAGSTIAHTFNLSGTDVVATYGSASVSYGTGVAVALGTVELGHATDTTLSRSAAGVLAVESVVIPSISSTNTLTNKFITPQLQSVADAGGTLTPVSITNDLVIATALSQATTIAAPTGSPVQGEKLIIRLKDNGTARALTWNSVYRASSDLALPTTTVLSKTLYCGFIYNSTDTKWDLVAYINNF